MIPRKCHVKRIYGKNSDGSENTDTWIDVLRIDELGAMENHGGQEKIFRLRWEDNPGTPGQDTTANTQRQTRTVTIPAGGGTGVYFEVKAIDRMLTVEGSQTVFRIHRNETSNSARQVTKKRVYHRDVTLPGEATWDEYIDALTAAPPTDTSQYVDVELVGAFANKQMQEVEYQTDTTRLKLNDDLDDLQAASPADTAARLDPFQMVVNVQAEPLYIVVTVRVLGRPVNIAEHQGGISGSTDGIAVRAPLQPYAAQWKWNFDWLYASGHMNDIREVEPEAVAYRGTTTIGNSWTTAPAQKVTLSIPTLGSSTSSKFATVSSRLSQPGDINDPTTYPCFYEEEVLIPEVVFEYDDPHTSMPPLAAAGISWTHSAQNITLKANGSPLVSDALIPWTWKNAVTCEKLSNVYIESALADAYVTQLVATGVYNPPFPPDYVGGNVVGGLYGSTVLASYAVPVLDFSATFQGSTFEPFAVRVNGKALELSDFEGRQWIVSQSQGTIQILMKATA